VKLSYLLLFLFVSSFASQALFILLPGFTATSPPLTTNQSPSSFLQPSPKIASEAQTIDSFDVNPANRYNITSSGDQTTTVDNSNLILTNYNNNSDSSYTATRQLTKTDSKVEWRSSSAVSGNISEYFRDQLGTPMTFDSSTQGWTSSSITLSQSNGQLEGSYSSTSNTYIIYMFATSFSSLVYSNLSFDVYASSSGISWATQYPIYFYSKIASGNHFIYYSPFNSQAIPTTKTTYNIPISSFTNAGLANYGNLIALYFKTTGANGLHIYFDNIQLLGSYNYPTINLGNNWGFDSSKEYFYDVLGNISNFADGTTEGWSTTLATLTNVNAQYGYFYAGGTASLYRTGLSISASTYKYLLFEYNGTFDVNPLTEIIVYDGNPASANIVCDVSSGLPTDTSWHLFTCNLGLDADWTGTETGLGIQFYSTSPGNSIYFNFIGLYDSSLGNTEGFSTLNFNYVYTDPQGYLVTAPANSGSNSREITSPLSSIDTTIYQYLQINIKSNEPNNAFDIRKYDGSAVLTSKQIITTSFTTYTIDLSSSTSWSGIQSGFRIYLFNDASGSSNFVGNEIFTINYILLTAGTQQQQPFQIGFVNPTSFATTLNVTQVFLKSFCILIMALLQPMPTLII